jgi:hypothetical protein
MFLGGSQKKQQLFPLYSIKLFVFITEKASVYCAVGTDSSNVIEVNFSSQEKHTYSAENIEAKGLRSSIYSALNLCMCL